MNRWEPPNTEMGGSQFHIWVPPNFFPFPLVGNATGLGPVLVNGLV
ncbi:hypothetical protein [Rubellicoccus peritrichatus]|uniref:Uncharacterized protein n=1 Tax=Rubellicoccus peritrichatus TaxID=3080537 RepID=A0AAQ3LDK8_9BACT|nr:hypothetical protein [Puniceicoccus sp. CR14]WOO42592.1 hypothetical protein RZN69_05775 [Puniceicoccus sp. CR14]